MSSRQLSGLENQTTSYGTQYSSDAITGSRSLSHRFDFTPANTMERLEAALFYASCGRPIIPLKPGAKAPLGPWKEQATTDPTTIRNWWEQWPDANIGMPMGNGIHALDLDSKNGQQGWKSYLEAGGNPDTKVPRQTTPSEGQHLLFLDARSFMNFTKKGAHGGIDMRTDGGYIAVAPSKVNGIPYRWAPGCTDPTEPLPEKLLRNIEVWGAKSPESSTDTVEMPTPSNMTDIEVGMRLAALPEKHRKFLLDGECPGGDRSAQAFATCMCCFGQGGWSLEDMARIAPETILATYGIDHGASDPLGWCWRQTITKAWKEVQKEKPAFEPIEDEDKGGHIGIEPVLKPLGWEETFINPPPPPRMLIKQMLPCDVFGVVGPGGVSKSTIMLWLMIHVILGRPVFGREIEFPGPCLLLTAEDKIDTVRFRIRQLCLALNLTQNEQRIISQSLYVEDFTGRNVRFVIPTQANSLEISSVPDKLSTIYGWVGISLAVIDPLVFFGPGERFVNDGEALVIQAARRLSDGLGGAAVGLVHHTGKTVAREAIADQYAGRGGSAFADNSRGMWILHRVTKDNDQVPPDIDPLALEDGRVFQLNVPKTNHGPLSMVPFWIVRGAGDSWEFSIHDGLALSEQSKAGQHAQQEREFVLLSMVWNEVKDLIAKGEYPTKTDIRNLKILHRGKNVGKTRISKMVDLGVLHGFFSQENLPKEIAQGAKKTFIRTNKAPRMPEVSIPEGD